MGKLDLRLQILNLQGKTTRAISFRRRSNFWPTGQLDLQVKTIGLERKEGSFSARLTSPLSSSAEVKMFRIIPRKIPLGSPPSPFPLLPGECGMEWKGGGAGVSFMESTFLLLLPSSPSLFSWALRA